MSDLSEELPRKPRPKVRRRKFTKLKAKTVEADLVRDCDECGESVHLARKGDAVVGGMHSVIEQMAAGELPVLCDGCIAENNAAEERRLERERFAELISKRVKASGIPPRFIGSRWDDIHVDSDRRELVAAIKAWGDGRSERTGMLMWGKVGRGKTRIAATAACARLAIGPVRWLNVADLLGQLSMPFDSPEYAAAKRKLVVGDTRAALVLDDLDKLRPSDHALQPLYLAVNGWVEAGQPLFVTLNQSLEEIEDDFGPRFGPPIASRLAEHCEIYELRGRDRRVDP